MNYCFFLTFTVFSHSTRNSYFCTWLVDRYTILEIKKLQDAKKISAGYFSNKNMLFFNNKIKIIVVTTSIMV